MRGVPEAIGASGRYEVLSCLGEGGFGVVYEVLDRRWGERRALKTLQRVDADSLYRFKKEFRLLADIVSPNLITLHELHAEGESWFFTMELVRGVDLLTFVRSQPDEQRLRWAFRELCRGVMALHAAGILHRDLKPPNVLVVPGERVVLLDFGLVTRVDGQRTTEANVVQGTAAYMAPEQARGEQVGEPADWYAVGVMLYQALTGICPHSGQPLQVLMAKQTVDPSPPWEIEPAAPRDLGELCMRLLARDAAARPGGEEVLQRIGAGGPQDLPAPAEGGQVETFVGRTRELALLEERFSAVQRGEPALVLVKGPSGIGKTALVQRFLGEPRDGVVTLAGKCYERESVPFKALDALVDALGRHLGQLDRATVDALVPRDAAALGRLFPALLRVPALAEAPAPAREIEVEAQETRRRGFGALRELITRLADRATLVLHLDDLQWGDRDSAALLTEIIRPPDPPTMLVIGSLRSEQADSPFVSAFERSLEQHAIAALEVALGPLDEAEARPLARQLIGAAGADAVSEDLVASVARESDGSPFFIRELASYVRASRTRGEQHADLHLDDVLLARVRQLPEEVRRLLEIIALAGGPIDHRLAARAARLEGGTRVEEALKRLRAERLVRGASAAGAALVEPYHDRIRETVVAALAEDLCRGHHERLAEAMETGGAADPEALADHLQAAGKPQAAVQHVVVAADRAARALAFDRAAGLYQLALELGVSDAAEVGELRRRAAQALANAGRGAEAAACFLEAARTQDASDALSLKRSAAEQFLVSGHAKEGLEVLRSVLADVGLKLAATPRGALASLLWRRLRLALRGLRFRERSRAEIPADEMARLEACWSASVGLALIDTIRGADFQAQHLLLALAVGEPTHVALALAMEAGFVGVENVAAEKRAERLLQRSRELAERVDDPRAVAYTHMANGIVKFCHGRWRLARESSQRAVELFRQRCVGVAWEIDTAGAFAAFATFFSGALGDLAEQVPRQLEDAHRRGDLYAAVCYSSSAASTAWLVLDDVPRARREVARARADWTFGGGFKIQDYWLVYGEAFVDLYTGDPEDARTTWLRMLEQWGPLRRSKLLRIQTVRVQMVHLRAAAAVAVAAAGAEDAGKALDEAKRFSGMLLPESHPSAPGQARLIMAAIARLERREELALDLLQRAEHDLAGAEMAAHAAAARYRRGQLLGGQRGEELVEQAKGFFTSQRVRVPERIVAMLAPGFTST